MNILVYTSTFSWEALQSNLPMSLLFASIPVDQAVEETVNKDTQTAGGTKGFALKPSSVQKHYMISEFRTSFLVNLRDICGTAGQNSVHHDLKPSRIEKDKGNTQVIMDLLENNWANPFDNRNTELVSPSSSAVPSESICNDLSKAQEIGEHAFQMFVTERLERNPPSRNFTDPIRKQNLKTFSSMTKTKKTATVSGRKIVLRVNCNLFDTIVLTSQSRDLTIKEVLSHPLGPIPWALATPEGLRTIS